MLTAMDLPKTALSEFLEAHMGAAIEMERMARAERLGYPPNQIPGAGGLSVRVVNNIMKKSEVKQRFGDIFCTPEVKFPSEFPYRQRVICLFQVRRQRFGRGDPPRLKEADFFVYYLGSAPLITLVVGIGSPTLNPSPAHRTSRVWTFAFSSCTFKSTARTARCPTGTAST